MTRLQSKAKALAIPIVLFWLLQGAWWLEGGSSRTTVSALAQPTPPRLQSLAWQTAAAAGIAIQETDSMGWGAYATVPIANGTLLGEYAGELITDYESQTRYRGEHTPWRTSCDDAWAASRAARGQSVSGSYLFDMGHGVSVDAEDTDVSSWCRFMNHAPASSHACNVRPSNYKRNGVAIHKPRFFAIREIAAGEELKYNYGDGYWDNMKEATAR
jgi:hypothetical protein